MRNLRLVGIAVVALWAMACSSSSNDGGAGTDTPTGTLDICVGYACGGGTDTVAGDTGGTPGDLGGNPDSGAGDDTGSWQICLVDGDCPEGQVCEERRCVDGEACPDGECPVVCPGPECPPWEGGDIIVNPSGQVEYSYFPGLTQPIARSFTVGNQGTGPLIVTLVGLAPGTPPDFSLKNVPQMPVTMQVGDTFIFDVEFDETTVPTPGNGTLFIRSNDNDQPEVRVTLVPQAKGDTPHPEPCIIVSPTSLNFGTFERGAGTSKSFTITSCGTAALSITEIKRGTAFFGLPFDEFQLEAPMAAPGVLAPGQTATQTISYTAGLAGQKTGYFEVKSSDPNEPSVRVDVSGTSTAPPMETQGITVTLDWDSDNCDVDLHFIEPGGSFWDVPEDCYFSNMAPDWGVQNDMIDDPFLDVDNVWGYGPENINIEEPQPGSYKVMVHFYSDSYGEGQSTDTNATINVYHYGQLIDTFGPTYLQTTDWTWEVCTIDWPPTSPGVLNVVELGNVSSSRP